MTPKQQRSIVVTCLLFGCVGIAAQLADIRWLVPPAACAIFLRIFLGYLAPHRRGPHWIILWWCYAVRWAEAVARGLDCGYWTYLKRLRATADVRPVSEEPVVTVATMAATLKDWDALAARMEREIEEP